MNLFNYPLRCIIRSVMRYIPFFLLLVFMPGNVFGQDIAALKDAKPFTVSGNFGVSSVFYNVHGRKANREPFSWMLTGSPVISVYGISFPFSFTVSEQERSFNQPFNQYGVSPSYKWIKLHLGYSNLQFSPFSLGGHSIMGAGAELNPGKFRFGFIYGRLLRPVPYSDTISVVPSYKRTGYSVKVGYGTQENFVDLVVLRAKDFANSITDVDGLEITPAENVVWSVVTGQKITKWLTLNGEFAQSVYTEDSRVSDTGTPFERKSNFLADALIKTNSTTKRSSAIDGNLLFGNEIWQMGLHFKQIGPDYQSMGAYYFQNNMRNITVEPGFKIKDKFSFKGSVGFQTDNIGDSVDYRTNRTIGSAQFNWQPSQKLMTNVTYSNYDLGQKSVIAVLDTLNKVSQTTNNLTVNQTLMLLSETMSNSFILTGNYQTLKDHNSHTADNTEYTTTMVLLSWYMTLLKSGLTTGVSFNYSTYDMASVNSQYFGPSVSVSKSFFKQKMNLSLTGSGFRNTSDGNALSTIVQAGMRTSYRLAKKHKIQIKYSFNRCIGEAATVNSYTENKGEISYVYSF